MGGVCVDAAGGLAALGPSAGLKDAGSFLGEVGSSDFVRAVGPDVIRTGFGDRIGGGGGFVFV